MSKDEEFRQFAEARQQQLLRSAFLLCGNWHTAEDLVQTTFGKLYRAWRHVENADYPEAYAKQVLYRCFAAEKRRKSVSTVSLDLVREPNDRGSAGHDYESRAVLMAALALLPPRCRAVVVLRFWEDYSVEQTAEALGITTGTVKSQTSRALVLLRGHVADSMREAS
jgi:RNA polymerase sigma-70 factor (sigma-E family)